tara:strand:+ start:132 stop:272 length:141 start_codon:yes stop_codon:yes gene_type:complete
MKSTTRDPMYGESKIKGAKGPVKPGDVTLPPLKKAKKKQEVNSVNA